MWSGELYLEYHRGTYTSQARTKRGNCRSEHLLREAELWATTAHILRGAAYPYNLLERTWQRVLLAQFHDILPGSSIAWVHRDAEQAYAEVADVLKRVVATALTSLAGDGAERLAFNAAPHARAGVPALGAATPEVASGASATTTGDTVVLDNGLIRVVVDGDGLLASVHDLRADRELLAPGAVGNLLQLHRDTPTRWDAWDIDAHYRRSVSDLRAVESVEVVESTPQRVAVRVHRRFNASTVQQTVTLDAGAARVDLESTGGLARATAPAQARLPARRARRPRRLGGPVRPRPPPDARQHLVGRRQVRDLRTSLGARRGDQLRRRRHQRRHLRP